MPAPSTSLASADNPDAVPTRLLLTVQLVSVSVPQLSMPPPDALANGHGPVAHGGPTGAVALGATRFPVMTLFEMVRVAPPLKSAFGGTWTPPPSAITPLPRPVAQLDRVTPPVIVTPSIFTV